MPVILPGVWGSAYCVSEATVFWLPHWSKFQVNAKGSGFGNLSEVGRQAFNMVASPTISFGCSAQVQLSVDVTSGCSMAAPLAGAANEAALPLI